MAVVITVAQQKGGAGKTTLAANLAAAMAQGVDGPPRRVALLDIDPQRSLARWHSLRTARNPAPAVIGFSDVSGWRLAAEIERLRAGYDVLIVDSPPQIDTDAKLAIRAASLVLIPVQPSPPDLWAAAGTLKLASAERRRACLVLNRAPGSGKLRATVEAEIAATQYPIMATVLGNRIGFASAFADGLGITETSPRSVGARELRALLAEIDAMIQ